MKRLRFGVWESEGWGSKEEKAKNRESYGYEVKSYLVNAISGCGTQTEMKDNEH